MFDVVAPEVTAMKVPSATSCTSQSTGHGMLLKTSFMYSRFTAPSSDGNATEKYCIRAATPG